MSWFMCGDSAHSMQASPIVGASRVVLVIYFREICRGALAPGECELGGLPRREYSLAVLSAPVV